MGTHFLLESSYTMTDARAWQMLCSLWRGERETGDRSVNKSLLTQSSHLNWSLSSFNSFHPDSYQITCTSSSHIFTGVNINNTTSSDRRVFFYIYTVHCILLLTAQHTLDSWFISHSWFTDHVRNIKDYLQVHGELRTKVWGREGMMSHTSFTLTLSSAHWLIWFSTHHEYFTFKYKTLRERQSMSADRQTADYL